MKILGIGTDLIEVDRIEKAMSDEIFLKKFLTEKELFSLKGSNPERYAGRWAAKEAIVKALGSGYSDITPLDIEITNSINGRPLVNFLLEDMEDIKVMISISHIKSIAQASAICYSED